MRPLDQLPGAFFADAWPAWCWFRRAAGAGVHPPIARHGLPPFLVQYLDCELGGKQHLDRCGKFVRAQIKVWDIVASAVGPKFDPRAVHLVIGDDGVEVADRADIAMDKLAEIFILLRF